MFNLKNFIINQIINLKVIKDEDGNLILKNVKLLDMLNENRDYEFLILKALMVNKNVENVTFYYNNKTIEISYKKDETKGAVMEKWANIVLSTILDNFDVVKNALENKQYMNDMVEDIECQLVDKLNEI